MTVQQKRIADRLQQRRASSTASPARQPALDDREFVGVEAGQRVFLAQHRAQALADAAQQLVADAMAKGVVDRLEVVDAEYSTAIFSRRAGVQHDLVMCWRSRLRFGSPVKASCWP